MDHRIPKAGITVALVCAVLAVLSFIFLNEAFQGPSVTDTVLGDGYTIKAEFDDTEVLPTKQPVMIRGLTVGKVKAVDFNKESSTATVEMSIDGEYAPVYADATAAIGERTVLGDPFVKLVPGTEGAGEVEAGGEIKGVDSVDFDEALGFLDERGRAHVKSTLREIRAATRSEAGAEELSQTIGGLTRTVTELRELTEALRGQEDDLSELVSSSAVVLEELGSREESIRSIVAGGRATLDALAANAQSLDEGLGEVPGVLARARAALAESRPLLEQTAPLIAELAKAAPELDKVLLDLPDVMAETVGVTGKLTGVPAMRELLKVIRMMGPAVPGIEAAARNMQPLLEYTGKRSNAIGNFFANLRGASKSKDAHGHWVRTAVVIDPFLGLDIPATGCPEEGVCFNGYPGPDDSLDPQPFKQGSYPRLEPFPKK